MIDVILRGQWFVLFCLLFFCYSRLMETQSPPTRRPTFVWEDHWSSNVSWTLQMVGWRAFFPYIIISMALLDILLLLTYNEFRGVSVHTATFLYSYRSFTPWTLKEKWQYWVKESWVGLIVRRLMGLSMWHYKCRPSPTPLILFSVVGVPSEVYM